MKKIFSAVVAVICVIPLIASAQFTHPGVTFNTQDLERMKNNINVEPWQTGY